MKYYVGMHVLDEDGNVYAKSEKWHNSKEGNFSFFLTFEKLICIHHF